jgi:tetratricopeptide (TPR) repeat protein
MLTRSSMSTIHASTHGGRGHVGPAAPLLRIDQLQRIGAAQDCLTALNELVDIATHEKNADLLHEIALRYTALNRHVEAERCCWGALAVRPNDPALIYNHATALIALGELERAEAALDRVIALNPADGDAWYNRATLRRQTEQRNHVAGIQAQLARPARTRNDAIALHYALAKELEDLGEPAGSFAALHTGARIRRQVLSYRVEDDLDTMRLIAQTFDADFFSAAHRGHADARPLFIVGLPRSGTTLVDRILSSHGDVGSRGEASDLVMAVVQATGSAANKQERVQRSAQIDFAALGARYCAALPPDTRTTRWLDKTPNHFLYLGIVAAALPDARIVHVRRKPMDACYAMYKTLFRMAYPFSYDLDDVARYWLGYDALMKHWRRVLPPGRLIEIDYEELVDAQEATTRRLLSDLGLDWQDACLHFERNAQPSLTASAAQVRQPIYRSSIDLWRRYAIQLEPLAQRLRAAGVAID